MNELRYDRSFKYDSKELLGIMRFDFYDGFIANKWNPRELIMNLINKKEIDLEKLQKELKVMIMLLSFVME